MSIVSPSSLTPKKVLWLALAVLTLLATVLNTISLFAYMDAIGYFQVGATTVTLFYIAIGLAAAICVAFFFLINIKDVSHEPQTLSGARFKSAAVAALPFGAAALFLLLNVSALSAPLFLILLTAISLLCGGVYFALRLTRVRSDVAVLWGYGAILSCGLSLILTYFDRYTQMNAPHKLSFHVCMILAMLALLLEQRDLLNRPFPRLCVVFTALAAVFCTATALPNVLAFAGGVYDSLLYLFFDIMTLGLAAYFDVKCAYYALSPVSEVTQ